MWFSTTKSKSERLCTKKMAQQLMSSTSCRKWLMEANYSITLPQLVVLSARRSAGTTSNRCSRESASSIRRAYCMVTSNPRTFSQMSSMTSRSSTSAYLVALLDKIVSMEEVLSILRLRSGHRERGMNLQIYSLSQRCFSSCSTVSLPSLQPRNSVHTTLILSISRPNYFGKHMKATKSQAIIPKISKTQLM